ncbi:MAG: hypothetical protein H0T89_33850, partial [Deltaproteobacteria bacterium]|nr:hypothetical protein [Deltaproteobacteria bacterium]
LGPRRAWLRALRPPPFALDAAVVEEYRTSAIGELAFSDDGLELGVHGATGAVVFERSTGRRVERAPRAPRTPCTVIGRDPGRMTLRWGEQTLTVAHGVDEEASAAYTLDGDLALVNCGVGEPDYDGDREVVHYLVDLRAGELRWRADRVTGACATTGTTVLSAGVHELTERDLATGTVTARWPLTDVWDLAATAGHVAVRDGDVIRVWELAALGDKPLRIHGSGPVEFTPDASRLVTGKLLCDARAGAVIAELGTTVGGWLEGGPPRGNKRLTAAGFVEILPMGLKLWDAVDGRLVVDDRTRDANARDAVCFDRAGQYVAIAFDRGTLAVHTLREGTVVLEHAATVMREGVTFAFGFSDAGDELWWLTSGRERWVARLSPVAMRRLADDEPFPEETPPATVAVTDGCLVIGNVAIPSDDREAVIAPDGRAIASQTSHYFVEGEPLQSRGGV